MYKEETRINSISGLEYFTFQHQFFLPCYKHIPLGGGASGSMVVNEKNEVVGIY
ncbi:MAG: DUF31 family protein [Mycoplasmoidaceae bacterium]|nr:DUF31 family protein [Mycoplasmoidaceae bacterium]